MKNKQPAEKTERNKLLVEYYLKHASNISMADVGKMFGISRQRVSRILQRARQKKDV